MSKYATTDVRGWVFKFSVVLSSFVVGSRREFLYDDQCKRVVSNFALGQYSCCNWSAMVLFILRAVLVLWLRLVVIFVAKQDNLLVKVEVLERKPAFVWCESESS